MIRDGSVFIITNAVGVFIDAFFSSRLVSPMYCLEHLEQVMMYIKLRVLQVMLPMTL